MPQQLTKIAREYGMRIAILIAIAIVFLVLAPTFRGSSSLFATFEGFAFVGLVALGVSATMIAGELDMSIASMAAFAGVIAVRLSDWGLLPSLIVATLVATAIGALQGFLINRLGINSLVFTVGSLILLRGLTYILSGDAPVLVHDFAISDALLQRWGVFSPPSLLAFVLFAAGGLFFAYTRPGRELYAIGGARSEAIASGVSTRKSLITAFAISGGGAGLAGSIACIRGGSAAPEGFANLLLVAVAAALIGGVSLYGGRGTIWHIVLGVAIVSVLTAGMASLAAPSYMSDLVTGLLLIVLILVDFFGARFASARRLRARERHSNIVSDGKSGVMSTIGQHSKMGDRS